MPLFQVNIRHVLEEIKSAIDLQGESYRERFSAEEIAKIPHQILELLKSKNRSDHNEYIELRRKTLKHLFKKFQRILKAGIQYSVLNASCMKVRGSKMIQVSAEKPRFSFRLEGKNSKFTLRILARVLNVSDSDTDSESEPNSNEEQDLTNGYLCCVTSSTIAEETTTDSHTAPVIVNCPSEEEFLNSFLTESVSNQQEPVVKQEPDVKQKSKSFGSLKRPSKVSTTKMTEKQDFKKRKYETKQSEHSNSSLSSCPSPSLTKFDRNLQNQRKVIFSEGFCLEATENEKEHDELNEMLTATQSFKTFLDGRTLEKMGSLEETSLNNLKALAKNIEAFTLVSSRLEHCLRQFSISRNSKTNEMSMECQMCPIHCCQAYGKKSFNRPGRPTKSQTKQRRKISL